MKKILKIIQVILFIIIIICLWNIINWYLNNIHTSQSLKEIEEIGHEKFILEVLNKEKNDNIRRLMSTNLNSNFTLNDYSTDASVHLDNKIQEIQNILVKSGLNE